jgi:stage III sporulation protein AF
VLLASLVDLLLPNRTMQRYVRLVAGLLVLMTVATPLLHWFKQDFGSELSAEMNRISFHPTADPAELEKIRKDAAGLSESRDRQAARLASNELAAQIEAVVDQSGAGEVRKVDVQTDDGSNGGGQVTAVTVWLAGSGDDAKQSGVSDEIEPVAPVVIDIDGETDSPAASAPPGGGDADAVPADASPADEATSGRVAALVSSQFGIATDRIRVFRDAGDLGADAAKY